MKRQIPTKYILQNIYNSKELVLITTHTADVFLKKFYADKGVAGADAKQRGKGPAGQQRGFIPLV